jgi:hypothetical protein
MRTKLPYCVAAVTAAFALTAGASAQADTSDGQALTSSNWAGYEAAPSSNDTSEQKFSRVSGSWVQPNSDCSSGDGSAAFWVGLGGGGNSETTGLEQVGTEIDCSADGQGEAHAWYELIPAAPVTLDVAIKAGDHISAWVEVDGNDVKVNLTNETTGKSATKDLSTQNIDVSSAEWIAEAPSECSSDGGCTPVSLADFGDVSFTSATATMNGHTGSITDSAWSSAPLQLSGSNANAVPTSLSNDGSSFGVSYQGADAQTTDPYGGGSGGYGDGGYTDPYGNGSPYGDGSGAYGDGSGAYGDGSGAYGDGSDPYGDGGGWDGNPYSYGGGGGGWDYGYSG